MTRAAWSPMYTAWTAEQEAWLGRHAGDRPVDELAQAISSEFGVARTVIAVRLRASKLGISLWVQGWSITDLMALFGTDHRVIKRWWIEPGLLVGKRWSGRGPNTGWWFDESEVERFVRACPWAYDATRMQAGHRLTVLATVIQQRDPWVTTDVARAYIGISATNFKRWKARGLMRYQYRYKAGTGRVLIRASDLPGIKVAIEQARTAMEVSTRTRFVAWRRAQAGRAA